MRRLYLALFLIGLVGYGVVAWGRIWDQSKAPHFVYQADAWLSGKTSIAPVCGPCGPNDTCDPPPPRCEGGRTQLPADDWATVETVELLDRTQVEGRRLVVQNKKFRLLDGTDIGTDEIRRSIGHTAYVSFPPFPALLMIPSALISGRAGNDVIPTLLVAAAILPLGLLLLRRLAEAGHSKRSVQDDLWLVAMLAFGSVLFFASVQGKVWYTAHVCGVALALVYAWASIEARHPVIAGLALGAAALTRTSMAFMFPLFIFEAWRMAAKAKADDVPPNASGSMNLRAGRKEMVLGLRKPLLQFAAPIVAFAIIGMIYNYVRFDSPTEFGHSYLALGNRQPVRQQVQIEQWGLASFHYLSRNLSVALTLLPDLLPRSPWISISGHGLAMWVTTPALLLLIWPRVKGSLHLVLWLTTLFVALPPLLYMNSGWFQFGYRFSLDYIVFMMMLLAIGGRPLGALARTLIVIGVVVNLFGAWSFDREHKYYRTDHNTYNAVIGN